MAAAVVVAAVWRAVVVEVEVATVAAAEGVDVFEGGPLATGRPGASSEEQLAPGEERPESGSGAICLAYEACDPDDAADTGCNRAAGWVQRDLSLPLARHLV